MDWGGTDNLAHLFGPLVGSETDVGSFIFLGDGLGNTALVEMLDGFLLGVVGPLRSLGLLSVEGR